MTKRLFISSSSSSSLYAEYSVHTISSLFPSFFSRSEISLTLNTIFEAPTSILSLSIMVSCYQFLVLPALCLFLQTALGMGTCLSSLRDPDSIDSPAPVEIWTSACPKFKGDAPPGGWNCAKSTVKFPTVDCIKADMEACGMIGTGPTVFYSMGAGANKARIMVRDKLSPKGVMFNDALPQAWTDALKVVTRFSLTSAKAQTVMAAKISVALAELTSGEAIVVVKKRDGDFGGVGAYQDPDPDIDGNVWRDYEFPTLQKNSAVTKVICIGLEGEQAGVHVTDWTRGGKDEVLTMKAIPEDPPAARRRHLRRSKKTSTSSASTSTNSKNAGLKTVYAEMKSGTCPSLH